MMNTKHNDDLTPDLDHEAGGEAGAHAVDGGAEELAGVVSAHPDHRVCAVHTGLPHLSHEYRESLKTG